LDEDSFTWYASGCDDVPGVAITRDAGEGRQISVRGLGAQFTRVRINGMESCISQAEKITRNHGFTESVEVVGSEKMRDFHADHKDNPLSITVSCSTKLGGAAIAVAGMNNDDIFAMTQKVYDDF
jgi:hypothetical protein